MDADQAVHRDQARLERDNLLWFVLAFLLCCTIPFLQRLVDGVQTSAPAEQCPRPASSTSEATR